VEKDYVPALLALAGQELAEGKAAKAREIALNLQKLHPKSAIGHHLEGDVHAHGGAQDQAAKAYAQAYRLEPTGQRALLTYGAYKRAGDVNNAVAALTDWLAKQPGDTTVRVALASDYHQRGKTADAIREYETARKQEPSSATVLNNLGWLYFQQGDVKGLEYAKKAYELAPQRPEIADTYGWILLQKTDPKKALTILQEAAVQAPHMGSIRYHLAVALDKNGRKEDARKELQRLLDSNKDFPEAGEAKKLLEQLKAK
jgi:Tfp pilus assembly protein PilF